MKHLFRVKIIQNHL